MKTAARLNLVFIVVLFAGAGLFLVGWSILWLTRSSFATATITLLAALYTFGVSFHMGYVLWGPVSPRAAHGPEGTVIYPQKFVDQMFYVSFASSVCASVLYLCFLPFGAVDIHLPEGYRRGDIAICVFFIVFNVPTLIRAFKHGGEGHLRLDPDGFEVWNGFWGSFVGGRWEDVERIQDRPVRGRVTGREVIVFVRPKQRAAMFMSDTVTKNSDAMLEWVRFYWQHPEHRDELVDGRALRRLSDEKFTTE
jgi:hypothetical protein